MLDNGETQKEVIRPDFYRAIMIDFLGATISSDPEFILLREVDEHFNIIEPMKGCLVLRAAMPKFLQRCPGDWLTNSWKFMLSSWPIDNSATKAEKCRVTLGKRGPQNRFLTSFGQGCRIISAYSS